MMDAAGNTTGKTPGKRHKQSINTATTTTVIQRTPQTNISSSFVYTEDAWEVRRRGRVQVEETSQATGPMQTNPKTDYTYSRSGSYKHQSVNNAYVSPNMSRQSLKGTNYLDGSVMHQPPVFRMDESYATREETHHTDVSEHESEELSRRLLGVHGLRLPASSTRSGRKYGGRWDLASLEERRLRRRSRRTGNDQEDETGSEYSVNEIGEYKTFEKQLEYSGNASLYKERSLNHLYGLDHTDAEVSDCESNEGDGVVEVDAGKTRVMTRTTLLTILTTILTTIVSTVTSSMGLMRRLGTAAWRQVPDLRVTEDARTEEGVGERSRYFTRRTTTVSETTEATSDISETVSEQTDRSLSETDRSLWSRFLMALNWLWMVLTSGVGFLVFLPVSLLAGGVSLVAQAAQWLTGVREHTYTETVSEEMDFDSDYDSDKEYGYVEHQTTTVTETTQRGALYKESRLRPGGAWSTYWSMVSSAAIRVWHGFTAAMGFLLYIPVALIFGAGRLLYDVVCWLTSTDTLDTVHVAGAESEKDLNTQEGSAYSRITTTTVTETSDSHGFTESGDEVPAGPTASYWSRVKCAVSRIWRALITSAGFLLFLPVGLVVGASRLVASMFTPTDRHDPAVDYKSERKRQKVSMYMKQTTVRTETVDLGTDEAGLMSTVWSMWMSCTTTVVSILWLPATVIAEAGRRVVSGLRWMRGDQTYESEYGVGTSAPAESQFLLVRVVTAIFSTITDILWLPINMLDGICQGVATVFRTIGGWITRTLIGHWLAGTLSGAGRRLYQVVTTFVLTDIWVLARTSEMRRRYGCCCLLPLLLLLPLFLTGSYYVYDRGLVGVPLVVPAETSSHTVAGVVLSDKELAARIQTILIAILRDREQQQAASIKHDWHIWAENYAAIQGVAMDTHRTEIEKLVTTIVERDVGILAAGLQSQDKDDVAKQIGLAAQQGTQMAALQAQLAAVLTKSDDLVAQLAAAKVQMASGDQSVKDANLLGIAALETQLLGLTSDLHNLRAAQDALALAMKRCCSNDTAIALLVRAAVEEHLAAIMGGGGSAGLHTAGRSSAFAGWLSSQFVGRADMDSRLEALVARLNDEMKATSSDAAGAAALAMAAKIASERSSKESTILLGAAGGLAEEQVKLLIQQALLVFGADKTGKVDYALESAGGSVISTRCSETYHRRTAQLSLFGIPLWYTSNSPRTIIQPDVQPGQCWAFRGTHGYLVIQLAATIKPTSVSVEHIPKFLSPTGKIDSAPKDFSVWGLESDRDTEGTFLGNYTYEADGEPIQNFIITERDVGSYSILELQIHGNHGNQEYTCLYRFRVHGVLQ